MIRINCFMINLLIMSYLLINVHSLANPVAYCTMEEFNKRMIHLKSDNFVMYRRHGVSYFTHIYSKKQIFSDVECEEYELCCFGVIQIIKDPFFNTKGYDYLLYPSVSIFNEEYEKTKGIKDFLEINLKSETIQEIKISQLISTQDFILDWLFYTIISCISCVIIAASAVFIKYFFLNISDDDTFFQRLCYALKELYNWICDPDPFFPCTISNEDDEVILGEEIEEGEDLKNTPLAKVL